jgi:hypothetical protein
LPSSLTRFHSRAWVYSTHPPVSDCGTGNRGNTRKFFLVPVLRDPVQPRPPRPCPALSNDSKIIEDFKSSESAGQTATFNRRPISTETSLPSLTTAGAGILNLLSIVYALRPRLRSRLTLGGRTFPRKPWVYGGQEFDLAYRYSCLHPHFLTLHRDFHRGFDALRTLPYQSDRSKSIVFQSFGIPFIANHYRREIAR